MSYSYTYDPNINTTMTGAIGPVYSITNGASIASTSTWATLSADSSLKGATLEVKGNANFEGDVKIQGKSIADSIDRIEERLAILRPNEELEEKWENLRGLRKAYIELEAEIKEKELIWATLKK